MVSVSRGSFVAMSHSAKGVVTGTRASLRYMS